MKDNFNLLAPELCFFKPRVQLSTILAVCCYEIQHFDVSRSKCLQSCVCTLADMQDRPRQREFLNFWCRNYFFLILAHPVYKM